MFSNQNYLKATFNLAVIDYEGKLVKQYVNKSKSFQKHKIILELFIMKVNISNEISIKQFIIYHWMQIKIYILHDIFLELFIMDIYLNTLNLLQFIRKVHV